jgi:hypothetical protein
MTMKRIVLASLFMGMLLTPVLLTQPHPSFATKVGVSCRSASIIVAEA